jgi:hypothetical protein
LPLCLQTARSPLQTVLQNRVHKLGCIPELTYQNQRPCDWEGTYGLSESLVGTLLILRSFPCPNQELSPLAYELAKVGLGKLFLGEVYRYLHLMSLSLLTQKKLRTGGP